MAHTKATEQQSDIVKAATSELKRMLAAVPGHTTSLKKVFTTGVDELHMVYTVERGNDLFPNTNTATFSEITEAKYQATGALDHALTTKNRGDALSHISQTYDIASTVTSDDQWIFDAAQKVVTRFPKWKAEHSEQNIQAIMELMLPLDPFSEVNALIEIDNAKLRAHFFKSVPTLTSAEVHEFSGRTSRNKSLTANRWKASGKIFAVTYNGQDRYPAFQFQDGEPRGIIKPILDALPDDMSPWQTALWFISGNGWLDGHPPMEALDDKDAVIEAALQENETAVG